METSGKKDIEEKVLTFVVFAIESVAEKLGIPTEEALSLFYNSPVFPFLTDKEMPLITMSDQWICDEVGKGRN